MSIPSDPGSPRSAEPRQPHTEQPARAGVPALIAAVAAGVVGPR
jgi:hypothetical protein